MKAKKVVWEILDPKKHCYIFKPGQCSMLKINTDSSSNKAPGIPSSRNISIVSTNHLFRHSSRDFSRNSFEDSSSDFTINSSKIMSVVIPTAISPGIPQGILSDVPPRIPLGELLIVTRFLDRLQQGFNTFRNSFRNFVRCSSRDFSKYYFRNFWRKISTRILLEVLRVIPL